MSKKLLILALTFCVGSQCMAKEPWPSDEWQANRVSPSAWVKSVEIQVETLTLQLRAFMQQNWELAGKVAELEAKVKQLKERADIPTYELWRPPVDQEENER